MAIPSSPSPKFSINPITKILDAILGFVTNRVFAKIKRSDRGVAILRRLHLIPDFPERDFDSVYAYSLAEYGKDRPRAAIHLFRHEFIKSTFKKAFEQQDSSIIRKEVESLSEWSDIGKEFRKMDCDPRKEIPVFAEIFYQMVQLTRDPADVVQDQMLLEIKDGVDEVKYQLLKLENKSSGELVLSLDWCRYRFQKQLAGIGDKYIPDLHTSTDIDKRIHAILGDDVFVELIQDQISNLEENFRLYSIAVDDLSKPFPRQIDWNDSKDQIIEAANNLRESLESTLSIIKECLEAIKQFQLDTVRQVDWSKEFRDLDNAGNDYAQIILSIDIESLTYSGDESARKYLLNELRNKLHSPKWHAEDFFGYLIEIIEQMSYLERSYLHLIGSAGIGKTHLVTHINQSRLEKEQPSIFFLGRHFTTGQPIHEQLKSILDIPQQFSWQDFLSSLSTFARNQKTRIPILIDGLNEATHQGAFSKIWEIGLREFIAEIESYDELVLITTCRASYIKEIWPDDDDSNIITVYGFDSMNVDIAIEKYFDYYNIKADLTDASTSQFEHPIYLRIFCESKNPERKEEVEVYVGEDTVFEVFDDYLDQANLRIVNRLGKHQQANILVPTLMNVAGYLWENRIRGIPLRELVKIADDTSLEKLDLHRSITQAVESEGLLIYRDWYEGDETVFFSHDLLAGYLIAQNLITQSGGDLEKYLNSDEVLSLLFSEDYEKLHPLYDDIRHTLAVLLPVRTGRYLHEFVNNEAAFNVSIDALFEIPPAAINDEAVNLVRKLFEHPENRFSLLQKITSTIRHINHPFNARFLSDLLMSLSMSERDISWTELVRENADRFESMISRFENDCRNNAGLSDISRQRLLLDAEYVMWTLTSTVRSLRDKATRAMYWFGRKFPGEFQELLMKSFDVNDPYVSERMLAAAYGIAMARQYDFQDPSFVQEYIPKLGRLIYDMLFDNNAPHATTHILMRDYARRAIDIVLIHHPGLLDPEEQKRIVPPYAEGGIREWEESEYGKDGQLSEPIRMDFGNYTIGRLIKGRRNYDAENEEYRMVLSNIYWRIYNLGYKPELFEKADEMIAYQIGWSRNDNIGRIDRYGKKYSWIAFYEMAGYRQDLGLLNDLYGVDRISDADIDPSFPDDLPVYALITNDYLGDRATPTQDWILNGGVPDLSTYLVVDDLDGQHGPWVLLDGSITQKDSVVDRKTFFFPRGFIVDKSKRDRLITRLENQNLAGRWLPDVPGDYYTYAGEIPWADTYPYNGLVELEFLVEQQTEEVIEEQLIIQKDGKPLSNGESREILGLAIQYANERGINDLNTAINKIAEEMGYVAFMKQEPVKRELPVYDRIDVLIPVREYLWESYSVVNQASSTATLAREIAEHLDLCSHPQTFDLFEKSGQRATVTFHHGEKWYPYQRLIYIRKDLLDRYLSETNKDLVWAIWGERELMGTGIPSDNGELVRYKVFQQIIRYEP